MSFEINNSLKLILGEIKSNITLRRIEERFEFIELLKRLSAVERLLVAKYFCKLAWNLGSLNVLSILQQLGILTATEFVLSQPDPEQIQLILNDFLEAEYELITKLFIAAYYDSAHAIQIGALLDECLRRLYADLLQNPNLNNLDYLKATKKKLPTELLPKITHCHIGILLELHSSSVKDAFCNFTSWINEGVDDIKCTKDLYVQLIRYNEEETLSYLFKLSTSEHFKEWKFYLILLQTIASNCSPPSLTFIKKYLQSRIRQRAALPSAKNTLLHLLLSARAATAATLDIHKNLLAYADWYKQNIGEMKFVLKTEEFQNVLSQLEQCIDYEMEPDYLEIHSSISISPPVLCSKLVQSYKSKCKSRLQQIKAKVKKSVPPPQLNNESILIEDSD